MPRRCLLVREPGVNLDRVLKRATELTAILERVDGEDFASTTVPAARSAMWRVKCCFARAGSGLTRVLRVRGSERAPPHSYTS